MMNEALPSTRELFYKHLGIFFPNVYDIKTFAKEFSPSYDGGLNRIGEMLGVSRVGITH
jgi:hypothetical protein